MRHLLVLAALLGTGLPALAQESLLIGRVERISLLPLGTPACPSTCTPSGPDANGMIRVCVSNMGGCQHTEFQIDQVLMGSDSVGPATFKQRIGEWGKLDFPVSNKPILAYVDQERGIVRWSLLTQRDGHMVFEAKPFERTTVAGVAIASLPPDSNGEIALDQLIERLPGKR
jgi:hypothetical protein